MTHLIVLTNFNEMNELSNPELFLSSKVTYDQLPIMMFFQRDQIYYYHEFL